MINYFHNKKYKVVAPDGTESYAKPTFSRISLWDIRQNKECMAQLLKDMDTVDMGDVSSLFNPKVSHKGRFGPKIFLKCIEVFVWLVRKLSGHRALKFQHLDKTKCMDMGWYYTWYIGSIDDPHNSDGKEFL